MNRYGRGPTVGNPSKATASTMCQKCLKKDIYECKAVAQERPYVSRPSRTQQLLNPKLVPKLTSDVPDDLLRKKGIADEQLAKIEKERGRKHDRDSEDADLPGSSKRMRSASSSVSVSTISTGMSRSPSPHSDRKLKSRMSQSPPRPSSSYRQGIGSAQKSDSERKRRRGSISSVDSYSSEEERHPTRASRERTSSRSTRRKYTEVSPPGRGRKTESRSPHRVRRALSNDRKRMSGENGMFSNSSRDTWQDNVLPPRERSLSPFSKRLALTKSLAR